MKKQDRRTRKTKKALKENFISALQRKDLQRITVKELCEEADVNRSTFYIHYRDIYALWDDIAGDLLARMQGIMDGLPGDSIITRPLPLLLEITALLEEDLEFNRKLFTSREAPALTGLLQRFFTEAFIRRNRESGSAAGQKEFELYIRFVVSGSISLYSGWFSSAGTDRSLEEISRTVERLITRGVSDFLSETSG